VSALRLSLRATETAAREARRALAELPCDREVLDSATLLVSEVVTNSFLHAGLDPDDLIHLRAELSATRLRVTVCDEGEGFDLRNARDHGDGDGDGDGDVGVGGWGLYLVDQLAHRWGIARNARTCVWFEVAVASR
jgi:anti-sigma regulatory factor (Ser/Thr protein kinase)